MSGGNVMLLNPFMHFSSSVRVTFGSVPITPWQTYTPNEQALRIAYRNHNARVLQVKRTTVLHFILVKMTKM